MVIDLKERLYEQWEREIHAVMVTLIGKGLLTVDEMRRGIVMEHNRGYELHRTD
jgi:hypothetical protein